MDARRGITEGMTVYTQDGETLGKVVAVDDAGLFVEKGFFFPREYGFRFDDVTDVRGEEVHLRLAKEAVSSAMVEDDRGLERSRPSAVSEDGGQLGTAANPPAGSTANTGLQWGMEPVGTAAGGTSGRRSDSIQEGADARRIDALERTGIASGRVPVNEEGRGVAPSRVESHVRSGQDVTLPVAEEQLEARTSEREAGELTVHRRVLTDRRDPEDHHVP